MACEFQQHGDILIDYIEGRLAPFMRKAFEEHYFTCDRCFEALQTMEQAVWLMRHHGSEIFAQRELKISRVDLPRPLLAMKKFLLKK
jgi:anti-sigma factor RsiW